MLINVNYFIGKNNIPNTGYEEVSSAVEQLIKEHEEEYLNAILGEQLAREFTAGLLLPTIPAKWLAIKDGVLYNSLNGQQYKWKGLVNSTLLVSPLADYVYYWWLRESVTQTSGIGEVTVNGQLSTPASSKGKQAEAYNRMVKQNLFLFDYLRANQALYPSFSYFTTGYKRHQYNLLTLINAYGI